MNLPLSMVNATWRFTSMSVDSAVVYQVEQSFTGDYIYIRDLGSPFPIQKDSTHIENQISILYFEVQKDGKVAFFPIPVPYWGNGGVTFEKFIQSDKIDTCFTLNKIPNRGCLRKNVGIVSLSYGFTGNHQGGVGYSLIEGPTY